MSKRFAHLHVHTEYSIIDGLVRIPQLLSHVAEMGMPAVAVTDQSNLFGMVKFYRAALSAGVKPIIGVDVWLENEKDPHTPFHLLFLCQNTKGYKNVTQLITRAYLENQHHGKAIVRRDWLKGHSEGLIVLSGGMEGEIGQALLAGKKAEAKKLLQAGLSLFPDRFYLELQRIGKPREEYYISEAVNLAMANSVPVVATNGVRFICQDDFEAHEARVCVGEGWLLSDANRPHIYTEKQYLRSEEEMVELFQDIPEAIENSIEIAKRCNVTLSLGKSFLPQFPTPEGVTTEAYFTHMAKEGLEHYLCSLFDETDSDFLQQCQPYHERLEKELTVINKMGFAGYFLIVADFINWAKQNGVPVGPGRGSGAGSLIAYVLGITGLDPLQYDLLFERFLNPERVSMPDFDIDFCMDGRDRVIEYVSDKYGRESVSQIITYGTMAAKAVVRDVGRVLGQPYGFVDKIAKLIPFELGMTLDKALEQEAVLKEWYEQEEEVQYLIDLARKLEGLTRNAGKHAGGVVISPSLLTDFVPLYCEEGGGSLLTQFDKGDIEAVGLVKFDFLGLRTLTIIDWAVKAINQQRDKEGKERIDIERIPLDDRATFDLLKSCQTTAIFQLESRGMKDLIKRLSPDCFEDILALVALFRPGPLQSGMVEDFINRKYGRAKVEYLHDKLVPVLQSTYGVILYQEQVMQIAQVLAGYSLGEADILRQAMGKKKPKEMAKQRKIFIKGAVESGIGERIATQIFDLMEKFAGYGFNKSHSAAYAMISYQTAWLKTHYTAEFMSAVLSSDMDNTDKVVTFLEDCSACKLTVLPPHVNYSQYAFVVDRGNIIHGLGAVKGVGESAIENIIASREEGEEFKDLFDFCFRVDLKKANRRALEALIKSGAMDGLGAHRAEMLSSLHSAIQASEQHERNHSVKQNDLFGCLTMSREYHAPEFIKREQWLKEELLQYEKETLGFYLSGHPLDEYDSELPHFITRRIVDLNAAESNVDVVAGLVVAIRFMNTRRGERMAFISINDRSGRVEVAVFSDVYNHCRELLAKDQILVVDGEVSDDDYTGGVRVSAKKIMSIDQARELYAKHLLIHLNSTQESSDKIEQLLAILTPYQGGGCPVCIAYYSGQAKAILPLGGEWRVKLNNELLKKLREIFSNQEVEVCY